MEVLMQVIQDGSRTEFFTLKAGDQITDLLMLSDTGDNYVILLIQGRFTTDDIRKIAEAASK
jgi:hypothetical protein